MIKSMICVLAVLGLACGVGRITAQGKKGVVAELMQKKLKSAQSILDGIATANYAKIEGGAEALIDLTRQTEWFVIRNPKYELHTNDFRRAAESLIDKARQKNIDGAALAYVDLTLSCVRCHQHVRDTRDVRGPGRDSLFATKLKESEVVLGR
jgi:cytochrome c556